MQARGSDRPGPEPARYTTRIAVGKPNDFQPAARLSYAAGYAPRLTWLALHNPYPPICASVEATAAGCGDMHIRALYGSAGV
jgi:hypothetical protein